MERGTNIWRDATKERAFENDVESFDNIQKERGREGRRGTATGRRVTEE